jgi:hypothetical protein
MPSVKSQLRIVGVFKIEPNVLQANGISGF